jgi:TrmH family RNA methyltransferase
MISKSRLKYIQSLGQKKHRDDEGVFIAEGPKLVQELLQNAKGELVDLYALNEWKQSNENIFTGININEISESELSRISQLKTPNQVVGLFKQFKRTNPETKGKISLVLDTVQDPGNLGTIIRTADWFGISQVICSPDSADLYNPKVVQATMGSIARVKVFYVGLDGWLKQQAVRIYGALLGGKDVTKMSRLKDGLIIIGNESKGIDENLLPHINEKITIPKSGEVESLNAAVATGIILSYLV